jgi:hypothetical protein
LVEFLVVVDSFYYIVLFLYPSCHVFLKPCPLSTNFALMQPCVHVHEFLPSVTQLLLSCFSLSLVGMLQLIDNFPLPSLPSKGCCYGCTNNGSVGMKHPNQANAYNAGHPDGYLPFGHRGWDASDDDAEDV